MKIIVNGDTINVAPEDKITHAAIAGLVGQPGNKYLTVTYQWQGEGDIRREGILAHGESVTLAEGMRFTACNTGNA